MNPAKSIFTAFGLGFPLILAACGGAVDVDEPTEASDAATSKAITLPSSGGTKFSVRVSKQSDVSIALDCNPPSNPDVVGPAFRISSASLALTDTQARAGRWAWTGTMPVGTHTFALASVGGVGASCTLKTVKLAAARTCRTWSSWRSPNTNHTHMRVGSQPSDWEALPASGNHWGAWAAWATVYEKPVKRGYLLHNLEHGGLVYSYKCTAATDSKACTEARDQLIDLANEVGEARVIVTPDPTQTELFAVRGWREAYSSSCLDVESAKAFALGSIRHGREDVDADPPVPFDPTTTNVPCYNLMAAPDSCP